MPIVLAILAIIGAIAVNNAVDTKIKDVPLPTSTPINVQGSQTTFEDEQPTTSQEVKGSTVQPTIVPAPARDSDPFVICNSKTGKITVRLSVCKSYTDCPDGNGGYIFESQAACKSRWENIGKKFKNTTDDYIKAIKERGELESLQRQLQTQQYDNELKNKLEQQSQETDQFIKDLENKSSAEYQRILQEQRDYFKNFIITPSPSPTPQSGGGRVLDPHNTIYAPISP